jgi:aspartokinase/homoserine dehydrogenase 1
MLVAIEEKEADKAKKAADEVFAYEISLNKVEPLKVECGFSIISLIGDDMKNQSGASGRMFEAIAEGTLLSGPLRRVRPRKTFRPLWQQPT